MRTFAILSLMLFTAPPRIVSAGDGHIEIRKHRFSKHKGQKFERLVLEFKQEGGKGLPNVRVGTDGAAGEVSVQVTDVNLKGAIPEASINDSFVPKSKMLGPISVATDSPRGGFTLRTFLKSPDAKVDAFWLDNPSRLVVDAYTGTTPRTTALPSSRRSVAGTSRHGKRKLSNRDFVCFPSQSAVGMKVAFQSKGGKGKPAASPVAIDNGPKGTGEGDSVVCYPKQSQVVASISFDTPTEAAPLADVHADLKADLPDSEPAPAPVAAAPIRATSPGAPANSIHNKSPQSNAFEAPKPLAIPSAETKPIMALPPAAPVQAAKEPAGLPSTGLSLPPTSTASAEPARMPTAAGGKPSLNLPLSLPSLPQSGGSSGNSPAKLSLPPPQQTSQAPALLPPISK